VPRLYLVRHAKSDWPFSVSDFDRPLAPRGISDCDAAREYFRKIIINRVEVSPAARTLETLRLLSISDAVVKENPSIYEAPLGALLECVNSLDCDSVVLIGHSPGMPSLAWYFASNHELDLAQKIRMKYPTLGIAVLESPLPFSQWHEGCAELVDFVVPRA
jgi:phosphohistidine phosphatase